jgi:hypothetical protein
VKPSNTSDGRQQLHISPFWFVVALLELAVGFAGDRVWLGLGPALFSTGALTVVLSWGVGRALPLAPDAVVRSSEPGRGAAMSTRSWVRRFLPNAGLRLCKLARPLVGPCVVYEGDIYLRPVGRGVVLIDELFKPELDEWLEQWLDHDTGLIPANTAGRVRITVEYLGGPSSGPEDW